MKVPSEPRNLDSGGQSLSEHLVSQCCQDWAIIQSRASRHHHTLIRSLFFVKERRLGVADMDDKSMSGQYLQYLPEPSTRILFWLRQVRVGFLSWLWNRINFQSKPWWRTCPYNRFCFLVLALQFIWLSLPQECQSQHAQKRFQVLACAWCHAHISLSERVLIFTLV